MPDAVPYTGRMSRDSRRVRGVWPGLMVAPLFCTILTAAVTAAAQDWPQWRGPGNAAISTDAPLPTTWSPTEHLAWRAALAGAGTSSPIVAGDRVIVTSQVGRAPVAGGDSQPRLARDDRSLAAREAAIAAADPGPAGELALVVEAFDRVSGRRLWAHRTPAVGPFPELHEKHNLATPTPVTDGERVYAWFGNGQLVALDLAVAARSGRVISAPSTGPSTRNGDTAARPRFYRTS